jgi:hypothetical protein
MGSKSATPVRFVTGEWNQITNLVRIPIASPQEARHGTRSTNTKIAQLSTGVRQRAGDAGRIVWGWGALTAQQSISYGCSFETISPELNLAGPNRPSVFLTS